MNNAMLQQVVEALPDAAAIFDPNLRFVYLNRAFVEENRKFLGFELKAGDYLNLLCEAYPHLAQQCLAYWLRALSGVRCEAILPAGNPAIPYKTTFSPIFGDDGRVQFVIMTNRNVQAEVEALANERFYRSILEHLPVGLHEFTPEGWHTNMNDMQRRILGEDHPAASGQPYNVFNDPLNARNGLKALLEEVKRLKTPVKQELFLKYVEETQENVTRIQPLYYETTGFPVLDEAGNVAVLFLILNEITEKKLAVLSLEKSERLLHTIVEHLPVGYIQFDNFGFIRRVNQTQRRFFLEGETPRHARGMHEDAFSRLFQLNELFVQVLQKGKMVRLEKKLDNPDTGQEMFLDLTMFPVEDPVDKDQIVVALVDDITEKKQQELDNIKANEFLQQTGEIGKIGGWEMDMFSQAIRWSTQTYKIHELPPYAVMTPEKALSFFNEESRKRMEQAMSACMERGKAFDLQLAIITARENQLQVRVIGKPEYRNGRIVRIYGVIQDITEQYKIRHQLTRNTELMRLFFDTIDMGYAVMDGDGKVNFINRKAQEIVDHGKVIGRNIFEVFPSLVGSTFHSRVQLCMQLQAPVSFSNYLPATDKWYEFLLAPMQDGNISIFTRNITDSKKMQRELRKANEQLSSLNKYLVNQNKQLEDFAHITSHNLRAPIANLKALMQIMNEADTEEERDQYRGMFSEVIYNIDETLNDLIEVVQIRKDLNVERERLGFSERLQKVKDILLVDIETSGIHITTDFDAAPDIEYPRIYLDSLLQNLLTNAIKYRSTGRRPRLHLESRPENGGVVLTAEDNGQGIDMERYGSKLFGFRKTFHKNKDAKGIGLFITKSQVEAMGGTIQAESRLGHGTKFIITFRPE
ncbi:PAS domain-containing protein [Chitinophaga lutea]